ncbi:RICIN domain-containing protein [Micromonospora sp. DT41]|uniref:RICIN domain-containing protein n=1 Tax=Micromonospora sp. DT41 TaxID=3393437 RepID=UPI003CEA248F
MSKVKWATGAVLVVCGGALVACQSDPTATPVASSGPAAPASATASATVPPSSSPASASPPSSSPASVTPSPRTPAGSTDRVLSGTREVTIVRVQSPEGGIALDGQLMEVDDDSGRQLFVPTPLGGDTYLIKAYGRADGHPANDEPACWQVDNPGNARPLTIEGAVCDPDNPAQRFTITASGKGAYAISNRSAYLQHSPSRGIILEEVGDAPLRSTFRLVDNGPARRPAGG